MLKLKLQYFGHVMWRADSTEKKDWGQEEKGTTEDKMVGGHYWLNGPEFEQAPGDGEGTGKPGVLQSMGSQSVGHDWVNEQQQLQRIIYQ